MERSLAIQTAKSEVMQLFAEDGATDIQLEEIYDEDGFWVVTVSFYRQKPDVRKGALADMFPARWARDNKVVRIGKAAGEIISVKNYFPEAA